MTALLILGIGLAGFGVLVLLKFPDRPGGTIRLHRMEVSSAGAGLPLIALGIIAMVFSALGIGTADGPLPRPIVRRSPTSTSEVPSPTVSDTGTVDLQACCVHFFGVQRWEQKPAVIGHQRYDTTLRWACFCSVEEGGAAIVLADQRITRLTAMIGIANDADISGDTQATVVVKIDGIETKQETFTVVKPMPLDLNVTDVGRVELLFTGDIVPVVIAGLTGHQD